jgi:hypothetical protein
MDATTQSAPSRAGATWFTRCTIPMTIGSRWSLSRERGPLRDAEGREYIGGGCRISHRSRL